MGRGGGCQRRKGGGEGGRGRCGVVITNHLLEGFPTMAEHQAPHHLQEHAAKKGWSQLSIPFPFNHSIPYWQWVAEAPSRNPLTHHGIANALTIPLEEMHPLQIPGDRVTCKFTILGKDACSPMLQEQGTAAHEVSVSRHPRLRL